MEIGTPVPPVSVSCRPQDWFLALGVFQVATFVHMVLIFFLSTQPTKQYAREPSDAYRCFLFLKFAQVFRSIHPCVHLSVCQEHFPQKRLIRTRTGTVNLRACSKRHRPMLLLKMGPLMHANIYIKWKISIDTLFSALTKFTERGSTGGRERSLISRTHSHFLCWVISYSVILFCPDFMLSSLKCRRLQTCWSCNVAKSEAKGK